MGVDAKGIRVMIRRVLEFVMNTTWRFLRSHPAVSCVFLLFFLLYKFFPSVFCFLIYFSPILTCLAFFVGRHLQSRALRARGASRNEKNENAKLSSDSKFLTGERKDRCYLKQLSVRRNARRRVEEWDLQSQTREDEKDKVILTTLYNDMLGRKPQFEDSPKRATALAGVDKKESSHGNSSQKAGSSPLAMKNEPSFGDLLPLATNVKKWATGGSGETEEEDNGREDINQNDVMEPGISEVERNRRLESLMARRRARSRFKLAIDHKNFLSAENINPGQIVPHISVSRNCNAFDVENNADRGGLHMPGSAPCVLLPARNPFDLPYDLHEEKPNLTGDSFAQEFATINPKDMFFCRHESFHCSPVLSPGHLKNSRLNSPSITQKITNGRRLDTRNDNENKVERGTSQEGESTNETNPGDDRKGNIGSGKSCKGEVIGNTCDEDDEMTTGYRSEGHIETDFSKDDDGSDSNSSEETAHAYNGMNQAELREAIHQTIGKHPGLLASQQGSHHIPCSIPKGLPPRTDDHFLYVRRVAHSRSRTLSIASDLQVEVSDIGSPPTTVDGHDDGDFYMDDTDIDGEIAYWGAEAGFAGKKKHISPVSSSEFKPQVSEKDPNCTNALPSRPEDPEKTDGQSINIDKESKPNQHGKQVVDDKSLGEDVCNQELDKSPADINSESVQFVEQETKEDQCFVEDVGGEQEKVTDLKETGDALNAIPGHQNPESAKECKNEEKIDASVASINSNDSSSLTQLNEPSVEQVSAGPSSPSSSRSVLLDEIPADQTAPLNAEDGEDVDASQTDMEDMTRVDTWDEQQLPENIRPLVETSATQPPNARSIEKFEEPSGIRERSFEEPTSSGKEADHGMLKPEEQNLNSTEGKEEVVSSSKAEDANPNVHEPVEKDKEAVASPEESSGAGNVVNGSKYSVIDHTGTSTADIGSDLTVNPLTTEVRTDHMGTRTTNVEHDLAINPSTTEAETDSTDHVAAPAAEVEHNLSINTLQTTVEADHAGALAANVEQGLAINPSTTKVHADSTDRTGTPSAEINHDLDINPPTTIVEPGHTDAPPSNVHTQDAR